MSTIIMRIARILHSGRKRRSADLTPMVQALFFLVRDLAGCIIVTIELLNPHQYSVVQRARFLHPLYMYVCAARAGVPRRREFRALWSHPSLLFKLSRQRIARFPVRIEFWRGTRELATKVWKKRESEIVLGLFKVGWAGERMRFEQLVAEFERSHFAGLTENTVRGHRG